MRRCFGRIASEKEHSDALKWLRGFPGVDALLHPEASERQQQDHLDAEGERALERLTRRYQKLARAEEQEQEEARERAEEAAWQAQTAFCSLLKVGNFFYLSSSSTKGPAVPNCTHCSRRRLHKRVGTRQQSSIHSALARRPSADANTIIHCPLQMYHPRFPFTCSVTPSLARFLACDSSPSDIQASTITSVMSCPSSPSFNQLPFQFKHVQAFLPPTACAGHSA